MTDINEVINDLVLEHSRAPYDPVDAHNYYMRTRELKGRQTAKKPPSSIDKHREMDSKLYSLGSDKAAQARAKAMPKLTSAQIAKAKSWIQSAENYDKLYKSSGMEKKESDIFNSDKSDMEKDSSLNALYKNPVYKRLDTVRDSMFKTFIATPAIVRYYEIQDSQARMKKNAQKNAAATALARLRINPSKSRRNETL